MFGRPAHGATARGRALAACGVLVALVGGMLGAAPAVADTSMPAPAVARATSGSAASVATVTVLRSSNTVYPVEDGYKDGVRFAVRATNSAGRFIPVIGTATLTRSGRTIRSWYLDGTVSRITWDGRVRRAVRTGLYTLTVTEWSPDGITRTGRTTVRVIGKRRVRHELVTSTRVDRHSTTGRMPTELLESFARGDVKIRIRTVAVVRGPAAILFANSGASATVPLRDGTHTTPEIALLPGFAQVTITHRWARGAAKLRSLKTIWIYYELE